MSDLRYDPIREEYALIAPERLHRPDCYRPQERKRRKSVRKCPFCEGNESMTPHEIFALRDNGPDLPGWRTRVVPNLYKAVKIEAPWQKMESGPYSRWDGFGAHEVIIDTPRHLLRMDEWSLQEYHDWLYTLRSRLNDLRNDLRIQFISIFKNHGHYAASTQPHPHSQLIALPAVAANFLKMVRNAHGYYREHGRSLFEAIILYELEKSARVVHESESFIVITPYASRFAFETEIFSKEKIESLGGLSDEKLKELAEVLQRTLKALYTQLGDFDFNITFNTPPIQKSVDTEEFFDETKNFWRFGLKVVPRLFRLGGFEIGSGVQINPLPPEEAASLLKSAIEESE